MPWLISIAGFMVARRATARPLAARYAGGVIVGDWHGVPVDAGGDRTRWLERRRQGIGASDVSAILGMSPYRSAFSVWADKVHDETQDATPVMEFGRRVEAVILDTFEATSGLWVGYRQLMVAHPDAPWRLATLDGLAFESPGVPTAYAPEHVRHALGVVEAKSDASWKRWDDIPDHHAIQVQWQMMVTGLAHGWLVVLHGRTFETYEVEADPAAQRLIVDAADRFWTDHVLTGEPPDPDGTLSTAAALKGLWEPDPDKTIELSAHTVADVDALVALKDRRSALDEEIRRLENRVKVAMQDATVGTIGGAKAVTWKTIDRKGYTVEPTTYRTLRVTTRKD